MSNVHIIIRDIDGYEGVYAVYSDNDDAMCALNVLIDECTSDDINYFIVTKEVK